MTFEEVRQTHKEYKQKVLRGIWIYLGILGVVIILPLLLVGAISGFSNNSLHEAVITFTTVLMFSSVVATIIIVYTTREQAKNYRSNYKAYFVERNLAKTFTHLEYDHNRGLEKTVLAETEMVNTGDLYSSNDLVIGKYKEVGFRQADVHIQVEGTDSDGDTTYTTIFKGRFMIFEFPKKFNFRLEIVEKFFGANRVPGQNKQTGRKFERIKLESAEFNKIFKTYAEDGFEAFYLLDPIFIENITKLGNTYKGKILLCFLNNKLIVGLKDGKDAFEPPNVFKSLDETVETEKIAQEISVVTDFVDKLRLNKQIFA